MQCKWNVIIVILVKQQVLTLLPIFQYYSWIYQKARLLGRAAEWDGPWVSLDKIADPFGTSACCKRAGFQMMVTNCSSNFYPNQLASG
ncbi:hypothetical protein BFJ68_g12380 [Fusarium oxysporum]|uniref:Uncharacterized protein n=1 Tax=Fusarium oxysporum TaxID=5507 RepID=A0A420Q944_FUSOX|nr:hypothetical protein BFJ68_g12380 [Fusarium oxysporum]RKL11792.1 hypothetical protein BFJ71_g273 [Fusarium oxysporum]